MGNRILKESIRRSPEIDRLSWFEEVVYYRLLTVADDYGRLDGRIVVLTHDLFPTRDNVTKAQVSRAIRNMISLGLLAEYQVDGAPYLLFPTWERHQHPKRRRAKYPAPPSGGQAADNGRTDGGQAADSCLPDDSPTRTRAESVSVSESVSVTPPPPAAPEEGARERVGGDCPPEDNPFGDHDGSRPNINTLEAYAASSLQSVSQRNLEELASFRDTLPEDLIRYAIDEACAHGAPRYAYVRTTLNRFIERGVKTVTDAKAAEDAFQQRKQHPPGEPERRINWGD